MCLLDGEWLMGDTISPGVPHLGYRYLLLVVIIRLSS